MAAPTPAPKHRELSPKEAEAHVAAAFKLERQIKDSYAKVHEAWWDLSAQLHQLHAEKYWKLLGYDTLNEFLAQPDLGMSRSQFFLLVNLWENLVVVRQIAPAQLQEIEPTKVREVAPAIMRGDVSVEDGLDDAKALGYRDIKAKYRPSEKLKHGQSENDSKPLAAEDEPERVQCEACGSWYIPDEVEEP